MTRDGAQIARDGVALRTAHASFVSALSDRRQLGRALGLGLGGRALGLGLGGRALGLGLGGHGLTLTLSPKPKPDP